MLGIYKLNYLQKKKEIQVKNIPIGNLPVLLHQLMYFVNNGYFLETPYFLLL